MFIINRCFKNIWLESQMIHVALFSFQRTTLSFKARFRLKSFASSDSFIIPHLFQTVKNFLFFFFVWVIYSSKALPIKERYSRLSRCLAATCIILQDDGAFVNTFFSKTAKFLSSCSKTKNAPITRCVILAIGGGTEIWTPDTAGMNRML